MWEYIVESFMWSIGGLIVGYLLGRSERQLRDLKRKVEQRDDQS